MISIFSLENFDVSPTTGFVPEYEPLQKLPEYFAAWEEVVGSLPQLIKDGHLRQTIHLLPSLDPGRLTTEDEWRRAHLVLSLLAHAYVWCEGPKNVPKLLPKCLAVPWFEVSNHLGHIEVKQEMHNFKIGLCPILTHYIFTLNNWKFIDPSRNTKTSVSFTGSLDEEGFVKALIDGHKAVLDANKEELLTVLKSLEENLVQMKTSLLRIYDLCDPEEFYNGIRPYLAGWQDNSSFPDGLVYEGVRAEPFKFSGGSAAESAVFQVLDEFLGVMHAKEGMRTRGNLERVYSPESTIPFDERKLNLKPEFLLNYESSEGQFLERMRGYMLPKHSAFIEAVSRGPSIRQFVLESKDSHLLEAYNHCVEKLKEFRNAHLQVAARYIIIPANKGRCEKPSGMFLRGTGGSGLMPFLKKIRNETAAAVCNSGPSHKPVEKSKDFTNESLDS